MKAGRPLALYLAGVFLGSALIAPFLYHLVQFLAGRIPALAGIAAEPFPRYLTRTLQLAACAGLWPLLRALDLHHASRIGLVDPGRARRRLAAGFAAGFVSLACVAALAIVYGGRHINPELDWGQWTYGLLTAALSAVCVSVIEELIFRGALFGAFRHTMSWPSALAASSLLYALLHFIRRPKATPAVDWTSGFAELGRMFGSLADYAYLMPGVLCLTLAGGLLCLAYQRLGSLYFSFGMHAGWIFWLKFYGRITRDAPDAPAAFWGSHRMIDGWLATIVLAILLAAFAWRTRTQIAPELRRAS